MSKRGDTSRRDALWTVATAGFSAVLQLAQLMVAARYLDAHQFGALAIINITVWIVLAFQDMGLSSFCIHLGDVPRAAHSTLFWISAGLGLLGALIVAAIAYPLAWFYRIPELSYLLPLLGINFFLIGLSAQYQANLVRTFRARSLAQFEFFARVIGFTTTMGLLVTRTVGVEAIVIGLIIFALVKLFMMCCAADPEWHPTLEFDRAVAPRALRYGAYQAGSQVINQLRTQADQLILGRALGPEVLGMYSLAKELISYPLRFMQLLFSRLTLPLLARDQHDSERLRVTFLRSLQRTAVTSAVVYSVLAGLAPWVVELIYGERFRGVAALMPWLAVFGALRPLGLNTGMLAQATGRTGNEFRWNLIGAVVTMPTVLVVAAFWPSAITFAIATSWLQIIITTLAYPFFLRPLQPVGFTSYLLTWAAPFLLTVAVSGLALWFPLPPLHELALSPQQIRSRLISALNICG